MSRREAKQEADTGNDTEQATTGAATTGAAFTGAAAVESKEHEMAVAHQAEEMEQTKRRTQRHALQIICLVVSRGDEVALQGAMVYWLMNHTLAKEGAAHAAQLQEAASKAQVRPSNLT